MKSADRPDEAVVLAAVFGVVKSTGFTDRGRGERRHAWVVREAQLLGLEPSRVSGLTLRLGVVGLLTLGGPVTRGAVPW